MFINLFNLIGKAQDRTPLEDFTTEGFAGILKNPVIFKSYIEWLQLPPGDYKVFTQCKYFLEDDMNCIVDLVIENKEVICFIEHKVDSKEGWKQLERYSKILDLEVGKRKTYLKYCTKRVDQKKVNNHHFQQFRWYDVANWLEKNHINQPLVQDYLNFLISKQMAQDTSISTDTVIALKKLVQSHESMKYHVSNALTAFNKTFPNAAVKNQEKLNDIRDSDRVARYVDNILEDKTFANELLYCIHFETVKLQTQIWVKISHPKAELLLQKAKDTGLFKTWKDDAGIGIFLDCKLYKFIESSNSDEEILNWFQDSFMRFREFIDSTPELNWDEKVNN